MFLVFVIVFCALLHDLIVIGEIAKSAYQLADSRRKRSAICADSAVEILSDSRQICPNAVIPRVTGSTHKSNLYIWTRTDPGSAAQQSIFGGESIHI